MNKPKKNIFKNIHLIRMLCLLLVIALCPVWEMEGEHVYAQEQTVKSQAQTETEDVDYEEDQATEMESDFEADQAEQVLSDDQEEAGEPLELLDTGDVPQEDEGFVPEDLVNENQSGPKILSWTCKSATSMQLKWNKVAGADGYEAEYDVTETFDTEELGSKLIKDGKTTQVNVAGLKSEMFYYVRLRSFKKLDEGNREFSSWTVYKFDGKNFQTSATSVKKSGKAIDFHTYLPKLKRNTYRVLQGSATDGTYNYMIYESYKDNKCIILKVNAKTYKKVKVSSPMLLDHGNDMTYNPNTKKLYVVHWDGHPYRISVVDPNTLKITSYKDIKPTGTLNGADSDKLKSLSGYAGISYNSTRKQFVLRCSVVNDFLILDDNLKPIRYATASKKLTLRPQSIESDADHIYFCFDKSGSYNLVAVYDWGGNFEYQVKIPVTSELQGIVKNSGKYCANFYDGHYVIKYKTKKVKWKKVKGKWKYKKVKVVKKKTYVRQSYCYKLSSI